MTRILFLLTAFIFATTLSLAQKLSSSTEMSTNSVPGDGSNGDPTNYIKTDLIPASPNASSIGRYGEVPVNLSTGSAQLSIPLFTVSGNELSLPITLNYSYDGYKPAQPVSWVGIGWTLNAGGVISRTIKDRVDNTASGLGYYDYDSQYVQDTLTSYPGASIDFLDRIARGKIDSEPDIYSFNFGNYSGKFIRFRNNFYCFPVQKFKISTVSGGFKIVTDDGVQYFFTETETSTQKTSQGVYNIPDHVSSWYLSKITNPTGSENIYLSYATESAIPQEGALTQTFKKYTGTSTGGQTPGTDNLFDPATSYPTWVTPKRLVGITSEKYSVTFSGTDRVDVPGTKALSRVTVAGSDYRTIKDFWLKQSYSGSLKLDTLIEVGTINDDGPGGNYDNADAKKHIFEYNGSSFGHNIYAWVDHYGYSTGKGNFNSVLLPNTIYPTGLDRSPVLGGTMLGAMTKVIYPTGGYTTFEYELNKKYNGKNYTGSAGSKSAVINRPTNNVNGLITSDAKYFSIVGQQTVTLLISRTAKNPNADGFTRNTYKDFQIAGNGITEVGQLGLESENAGKYFTFILSPGTYSLTVYCDAKENMISGILSYKVQNTVPIEGEDAGGLRIKRIVSYPLTGQPLTKEYSYTLANGFSSGFSSIGAYSEKNFEERLPSGFAYYSNYYRISNSTIGENYYMGVPHYYTSVVESLTSLGEQFSTRTDFKAFSDNLGIEAVKITKYKNGPNNALIPIERVQYTYKVITVGDLYNAIRPEKTMEGSGGPPPLYNYSSTGYRIIPSWKYVESVGTTRIEGADSIETFTTNGYDLNGTRNLLWSKTLDSRGKELVTRYKYPESYISTLNSSFMNANVLNQVWEQQGWIKSGSDSLLLSGIVTQYNNTNFKPFRISSLAGPGITSLNSETKDVNGKYTTLISDTRYEPRVDYTYDSFGKIIRQQLTGGIPISYKWAYSAIPYPSTNKNYVTADCKNATETEFYTEDFEEDASATTGLAHTGSKFRTGPDTINWTRPNSRSYVISYFYLSAGKWKLSAPQPYTTNSMVLSGGTAYDDIRIYPNDAQLNTYTIQPGVGMTSMIDHKGLTAFYGYDIHERLKSIRDQDGYIIKSMDYRYAGTQLIGYGAGPYSSAAKSVTFTRNNCGLYEVGSTYTYSVSAGKYKGATQAEADGYAQADIDANGQARANVFGFCTDGGPPE